jgi:hypothetical protein
MKEVPEIYSIHPEPFPCCKINIEKFINSFTAFILIKFLL